RNGTDTCTDANSAGRSGSGSAADAAEARSDGPARVQRPADLDEKAGGAGRDREGPVVDRLPEGDRVQEAGLRRRQGLDRADGGAAGPSGALVLRAIRAGTESRFGSR